VFFNVLNFADERLHHPGLTGGEPIPDDFAQFDLTLYASKDQDQLQLQLVYCTDLFESATITRLLDYFRVLLTGIHLNPDRRISALPFLTEETRRQLNSKRNRIWPNQAFKPFPRKAVEQSTMERFAQQVRLNPEQAAVRSRGMEWTYWELEERADAVACAIREKTLAVEKSRVALLCDHDAPMVAAILGSLKSGGALLNGATLCLFDIRNEGLATVPDWLSDERISIYHSTPTVYRQVMRSMEGNARLSGLRLVVLGGEAVHPADPDSYRQHCPSECLFVNGLGPTESTVTLQYFWDHRPSPVSVARYSVPVGYPVENTDVLLLNESDEPVDLYGVGEIVIRSRHIALGYWRRPELTRARFRPDPTDRNRRMYYTGDLGRLPPDGAIEFVGRRDQQLKIRGHRVECGEVETVLRQHAAVAEALVVAQARSPNDMVLVAYVVLRRNQGSHAEDLKTFARTLLPEHMVPASIVLLPDLPLTINGKVDHSALPLPDFKVVSKGESLAPRNPLEAQLASLLANVLDIGQVGILDNFFELGMHSLTAMQFLARIRPALQVEVPLRTIFETPTVASLAQAIEQLPRASLPEQAIMRVSRENYRVQEDKN